MYSKVLRRILIIFVVTILILPALSLAQDDMVTLEFWTISFGMERGEELFSDLIEQFEAEHPNIKVNMNFLPEGGYIDLMNTALGSGEGVPDVGWWGEYNWVPAALNLTSYVEADPDISRELFYTTFWDTRVVNQGQVNGLPWGAGANIVLYNKDVFDAAAVDYPTGDWTPAEYLEIAKAVSNPEKRIWGSDRPRGPFRAVWRAWSAYPYSDDSTTVEGYYNSEGSLAAFTWLWDLVDTGATPTPADIEILGTEGTGPIDLFLSGRLAMATLNNSHMLTARNAGIRFGAVSEPHNPEHERHVNAWSSRISIWENTEHPDEAWLFLKFFAGPEGQRYMMENDKLFPSIPSLREEFVAVQSTNDDSKQAIETFFDQLEWKQVAEFDGTHLCWRAAVRRVGDAWDLIMLGEIERDAIKAQLDADIPVLQQALDDCVVRLGS